MKTKKCRVALIAAVTLGAVAVTVYAATTVVWAHPCPSPLSLTCDPPPPPPNPPCGRPPRLPCPPPPDLDCWCEGEFNNDDHWNLHAPDGDTAKITHSHAYVNDENWLEWEVNGTAYVHHLKIFTADTGGDDTLNIRLTGPWTIVVDEEVLLDATDGRLEIRADSGSIVAR